MIKIFGLKSAAPFSRGLLKDLRLRWALGEAGLVYEEELIAPEDLATPAYRALQPFGQIPVYQEDGLTLFETGSIILHIADKTPALLPTDATMKLQAVTWLFAALNTVEPPIHYLAVIDSSQEGEDWSQLRPRLNQTVEERLDALAAHLERRDYLVGDRFTAADLMMTTVLRLLRHTGLIERRPTLHAFLTRCQSRPAFQKALADQLAGFQRHAPVGASRPK